MSTTPERLAQGSAHDAQARPLTGRTVLILFCAFFGVVFAVNAVLVRVAVSTFGGVEVASAYRAGLDYPGEHAASARQDRLGWSVAGRVARAAGGAAEVFIEARDRGGRALAGARVEAMLQRPADRRLDRPIVLVEADTGRYRATLAGVEPGQWDLDFIFRASSGEVFRSRNRVVLK